MELMVKEVLVHALTVLERSGFFMTVSHDLYLATYLTGISCFFVSYGATIRRLYNVS